MTTDGLLLAVGELIVAGLRRHMPPSYKLKANTTSLTVNTPTGVVEISRANFKIQVLYWIDGEVAKISISDEQEAFRLPLYHYDQHWPIQMVNIANWSVREEIRSMVSRGNSVVDNEMLVITVLGITRVFMAEGHKVRIPRPHRPASHAAIQITIDRQEFSFRKFSWPNPMADRIAISHKGRDLAVRCDATMHGDDCRHVIEAIKNCLLPLGQRC